MKKLIMVLFALPLFASLALLNAEDIQKHENYQVDSVHSSIIFKIKHFNVGYTYGRFNKFSGSFSRNGELVDGTSVKITIDVNSVDTGNDNRDAHLRKPDFFNTKQNSTIKFVGESASLEKGEILVVKGKLTLNGVTRNETIHFEKVGEGFDHKKKYRLGYEGTLTIKRSNYKMTHMLQGIGDQVDLIIAVENVRQ